MKDPRFLSKYEIKVNVPLAPFTSIGVGGNADFLVEVADLKMFKAVLKAAEENGLKTVVIGKGTNSVFSDHGYRGLVIINRIIDLEIGPDTVTVGSGLGVTELIHHLAEEGRGGFEGMVSLPGSVGGAVWGNSGVGSDGISTYLESASLYSKGRILEVGSVDLEFGYRDSRLKRTGEQVASATLRVQTKPVDDIKKIILAATHARLRDRPGASKAVKIFRDPLPETAAGLASQLDLAGECVGGAMISSKNPNYIINTGTARAAEVYELAQRIKHRVSVKLGKHLREEVVWLGEW